MDWLLDKQGEPWTWVMGDHKTDKTIEQILEEEQQKKADEQAAAEAAKLECVPRHNRILQWKV